ncbi:response regulator receiver modulated diguanylate cyclase, partial [Candidatus Magnetoovum chiemensis]
MDTKGTYKEKILFLKQTFINEIVNRIIAIETQWNIIETQQDKTSNKDINVHALKELHRMVHNTTGQSATFGFKEIEKPSRELEKLLKKLINDTSLFYEIKPYVYNAILNLKNYEKTSMPIKEEKTCPIYDFDSDNIKPLDYQNPEDIIETAVNVIYVLDSSEDTLLEIKELNKLNKYRFLFFEKCSELLKEIKKNYPLAVIININYEDKELLKNSIDELNSERNARLPIIYISDKDDFKTRLTAVQYGGHAFLSSPVDSDSLADVFSVLTKENKDLPYRVLIVDDDLTVSDYYAAILKEQGMVTLIVNESKEIMEHLKKFYPDLILMDMYMPECTGIELSKVIRQMDDFLRIPIVFLSTETDIDKQLRAMSTGADDFLTKSINPTHLISSVTIRAQRMRIIRALDKLRDYSSALEEKVEERTIELTNANN